MVLVILKARVPVFCLVCGVISLSSRLFFIVVIWEVFQALFFEACGCF